MAYQLTLKESISNDIFGNIWVNILNKTSEDVFRKAYMDTYETLQNTTDPSDPTQTMYHTIGNLVRQDIKQENLKSLYKAALKSLQA